MSVSFISFSFDRLFCFFFFCFLRIIQNNSTFVISMSIVLYDNTGVLLLKRSLTLASENTEGAIENGQSRKTDSIGYTGRRITKTQHNICWTPLFASKHK
jgi:hypothetical protein